MSSSVGGLVVGRGDGKGVAEVRRGGDGSGTG